MKKEDLSSRMLAAVMFTDIQGYTAMLQTDESSALAMVREHRSTLTEKTAKYNGDVIEFYGDGSLSVYPSARDAVMCAIEMQQMYRKGTIVPVRIGIHVGDITRKENSVFGNGVNVASRIESIGVEGSVLISDRVRDEVENQAGINTVKVGLYNFKNVDRPIEVYAIDHPDIVTPKASQIKGGKGRRVTKTWIPISIVMAGLCLFLLNKYVVNKSPEFINPEVIEERIAVPPFKNYTGDASLDYIGDMTAHLITQGLSQTEKANVVSFNTREEMEQLVNLPGAEGSEKFAKQSGALNIIDGAYSAFNDSLKFNSFIKRLSDGKVIYNFPTQVFSKSDPQSGILPLASVTKGYWEAKEKSVISMPNFEAYKYFMEARRLWGIDEEKALENLNKSIEVDSLFVDPYLFKMGYHIDMDNEKAQEVLNVFNRRIKNGSKRVSDYIKYYQAYLDGHNVEAYEWSQSDFNNYENDYFATTEYMLVASNLVNNYQMVVDIFEQDELLEADLVKCAYCRVRLRNALYAYAILGNYDKAEGIIARFKNIDLTTIRDFGMLVYYYAMRGDKEKINETINRAMRSSVFMGKHLLYYVAARESILADHEENGAYFTKLIIEEAPAGNGPSYPNPRNWAYYFQNDLEESMRGFKRDLIINGMRLDEISQIGVIAAKLGNESEALEMIDLLKSKKQDYDVGVTPYNIARIWLHLGEKEKALNLLQQSVKEGARFFHFNVFDGDVDLQSLISDPRYQEITHPLAN